MILTLEVSAPQGLKPGLVTRQDFGEEGGTIGRDAKNSWVLADSQVSSRHARITYRNRVFYIEDHNKSTNGIYLNSLDNRLERSRPHALKSGDRIFIRPYEIHVSIAEDTRPQAPRSREGSSHDADPFRSDDSFAHGIAVPGPLEGKAGSEGIDERNPLNHLPPKPRSPKGRPQRRRLEDGPFLEDHYGPPRIPVGPPLQPESDPDAMPENYNPLVPDSAIAPPVSAEAHLPAMPSQDTGRMALPIREKARAARAGRSLSVAAPAIDALEESATGAPTLADVLAGAGLKGVIVTPELASCFGQILRVVVSGLIKVLHARQKIKEEFGVVPTYFGPAGNNPLKFSTDDDDALHKLLVQRSAGYLGPVEAFADAFKDLEDHQLAMLAGLRLAFDSMLAEFDPDRLQEQFDRQLSKGSLLSMPAKLRYWDLYRDSWRAMLKDKEASFLNLFGEEFAKAYEEQMKRLKAEGRPRTDRTDKPQPLPPEE